MIIKWCQFINKCQTNLCRITLPKLSTYMCSEIAPPKSNLSKLILNLSEYVTQTITYYNLLVHWNSPLSNSKWSNKVKPEKLRYPNYHSISYNNFFIHWNSPSQNDIHSLNLSIFLCLFFLWKLLYILKNVKFRF